jgi:hypothetical protein
MYGWNVAGDGGDPLSGSEWIAAKRDMMLLVWFHCSLVRPQAIQCSSRRV